MLFSDSTYFSDKKQYIWHAREENKSMINIFALLGNILQFMINAINRGMHTLFEHVSNFFYSSTILGSGCSSAVSASMNLFTYLHLRISKWHLDKSRMTSPLSFVVNAMTW